MGNYSIVGIDEAGRGPLAGPVSVGAVAIHKSKYAKVIRQFKGARDSKKLSAKSREMWLEKIDASTDLKYAVTLVGNDVIDKHGIVKAIRMALEKCLKKLSIDPLQSSIFLDGSLRAPKEFTNQKTIIRGDDLVKIISLASIVAKTHRDAHMCRLAKKFPEYGLEIHKGYGTLLHRKAIKKHGPSAIHRRSFLKGLL